MALPNIPTVDLAPFFSPNGSEESKTNAMEVINQAAREYGFFQIINHGLSEELMNQALKLSSTFFDFPDEEKLKISYAGSGEHIAAGYAKQPDHSVDKNEYFSIHPPESGLNVYPDKPPEFKEVVEEVFAKLVITGFVVQKILNDCLCLPENFLEEYYHDQKRSWDFMVALRYFPATEEEENGLSEHEDGNVFTFVFQDDAGGLEVLKNNRWIPVVPTPGSIVVNISDVLQVLSNNKFKSATHRVIRKKGKSRNSYAFFFNVSGDKWIEPLPQFTSATGELPKYRGFVLKDYQLQRYMNKTHPPAKPEDVVTIRHYAINT